MFSLDQLVVYGVHGVCRIIELQTMTVNKKKVKYYVLEPVQNPESRFYVPCDSPVADSKLHAILNKQELDQILSEAALDQDGWIHDDNQRKQCYRDLIGSADRVAILRMIRLLYQHKDKQIAAGRKFHLCDENFLRDAERLMGTEFALVLDIAPEEVGAYIRNKMNSL